MSRTSARVPPRPANRSPLDDLARLTPRDHLLMDWLAEHYVLSSVQVATALFGSPRTARMRLTILERLGFVAHIGRRRPDGAPLPHLYTLGVRGLALHPRAYHDPANLGLKAPRSSIERAERIVASKKADHFLGVNQFFVDLHAHTRTHPDTRLARWWSEQHATAAYASAGIYPDGHGVWQADAVAVGFFLEYDRDTENLARVIRKLKGYERLAQFGPRYPVLLWVPHARRENSLLRALSGVPTVMPVATAVHATNPAGPIWALACDPYQRRALHHLPSDPGPDEATNPNLFSDQPEDDGDLW